MPKILNITNGDSAVTIMKEANIVGNFLPWRDLLHEGAVPADLSLTALSKVRAQYIIDQGWGDSEEIKHSFSQRDNMLKTYQDYDEIILWFEHDLYDQLQILQILDWFSKQSLNTCKLSMICTENYLGHCSPKEMHDLQQYKSSITDKQLALAKQAWRAFCAQNYQGWQALLTTDTSALPFLHKTIQRLLAEYPSCFNGLSRVAQLSLDIIAIETLPPWELFERYQNSEDSQFLGDLSFWRLLNEMHTASPALITSSDNKIFSSPPHSKQQISITQAGKEVLSGKLNWLDIAEIDRWIGGVHLTKSEYKCRNKASLNSITFTTHLKTF